MTIEEIKSRASTTRVSAREGCLVLCPPVELLDTKNGNEVVHANFVDVSGSYPNCVHIKERGYWWPIERFLFPAS